jgi:hypothetical protein
MQISILCVDTATALPEQQLRNTGSGFRTEGLQTDTFLSEYTSG